MNLLEEVSGRMLGFCVNGLYSINRLENSRKIQAKSKGEKGGEYRCIVIVVARKR